MLHSEARSLKVFKKIYILIFFACFYLFAGTAATNLI